MGYRNEIKEEIFKMLEMHEGITATHQNLWDTVKAMLRTKFTAISAYVMQLERHQVSELIIQIENKSK